MELTIKVRPSNTETVPAEELDSIRCPQCQGLKFWLSEDGTGFCADCDTEFTPEEVKA